jgi:hypothetical protein
MGGDERRTNAMDWKWDWLERGVSRSSLVLEFSECNGELAIANPRGSEGWATAVLVRRAAAGYGVSHLTAKCWCFSVLGCRPSPLAILSAMTIARTVKCSSGERRLRMHALGEPPRLPVDGDRPPWIMILPFALGGRSARLGSIPDSSVWRSDEMGLFDQLSSVESNPDRRSFTKIDLAVLSSAPIKSSNGAGNGGELPKSHACIRLEIEHPVCRQKLQSHEGFRVPSEIEINDRDFVVRWLRRESPKWITASTLAQVGGF